MDSLSDQVSETKLEFLSIHIHNKCNKFMQLNNN